ncbi:MAG TPA: cupin domain-containing protein [Gaiellaceae bacterium]|jgi:transcriptional regulator with XRE-family HTH domain
MELNAAIEHHDGDAQTIDEIGSTIRALRQERGLSLRDLSRLTGFSISFLSLVERGRSSLALTSLQKVATALGTSVASFFPDVGRAREGAVPHVVRAQGGASQLSTGSQRTYKLLSGRSFTRVLEPMLVTVEPSETIEEPYSHEGEEFAYVLSGELLFVVDGVHHTVGPGDSIHFQSSIPHSIHNSGREAVQAVWVLTPRLL